MEYMAGKKLQIPDNRIDPDQFFESLISLEDALAQLTVTDASTGI